MLEYAKNDDAFDSKDPVFDAAVKYGADALDVCCRYQMVTATCRIDLELQTYRALLALVEGAPQADAVACINPAHPFAHKVVKELGHVAQRVANERLRTEPRYLS